MSEWQPIETAPLETYLLVYDPYEGVVSARGYFYPTMQKPDWAPNPSARDSDSLHPTHWMPLPEPPAP